MLPIPGVSRKWMWVLSAESYQFNLFIPIQASRGSPGRETCIVDIKGLAGQHYEIVLRGLGRPI